MSFHEPKNARTTEPGNFQRSEPRKLRGSPVTALAIAKEYREIVPRALKQEQRTAKVIALRVDATPKSVENWREGLNGPSVPFFFALAREIPELRKVALQWLDADNANGDDPVRLANDLVRLLQERKK